MGCVESAAVHAAGSSQQAPPLAAPSEERAAPSAPDGGSVRKRRKRKSGERKRESCDGGQTPGGEVAVPSDQRNPSSLPREDRTRTDILVASQNSASANAEANATSPSKSTRSWTTTHVRRMVDVRNEAEGAEHPARSTRKKRRRRVAHERLDIDPANRSLNHNPFSPNANPTAEGAQEQQRALRMGASDAPEDDPRRFSGGSIGETTASFPYPRLSQTTPQTTLLRSPQQTSLPAQVLQIIQDAHQHQVKMRTAAVLRRKSPCSSMSSSRQSVSPRSSPRSGASARSASSESLPQPSMEVGYRLGHSEREDGWFDATDIGLMQQQESNSPTFIPLRLHSSGSDGSGSNDSQQRWNA